MGSFTIELPYYNLEKAFEKAAEKARDYFTEGDFTMVYEVRVKLLSVEYVSSRFNEDCYYQFRFEGSRT
jgi:hypothetical protein